MLLQLTVENVLSFKEQAVLSLLAAPGVEHHPGHIMEVPGLSKPILRVAAIYGPNASGKSNLIKAMVMARHLVIGGSRPGAPMGIVPFELDQATKARPSRLEFEFWIDDRRWSYGFACTQVRVHEEWLLIDDGRGEREVFTRTVDDHAASISIGDALSLEPERRKFLEFVAEGTRQNQLFLAEAFERNVGELAPLLVAFRDLQRVRPDFSFGSLPSLLHRNPNLLAYASSLLRELGTGVDRIELALDMQQAGQPTSTLDASNDSAPTELMEEPGLRIRFVHQGPGGQVALESAAESDGTLRLLRLAPVLFMATRSRRTVLLDELDRSLHALLSRQLLERFLETDPQTSGQLIFTTHDTNLLDLTLLPRDSIWFTEKDHHGGSTLYSLAEFEPRQIEQLGDNLEQGYLSGRFGAIPFLADPRRLGWSKTKAS